MLCRYQVHWIHIRNGRTNVAPCASLEPICLRSIHSTLQPVIEPPPTRAHLPTAWQKSRQLADAIFSHSLSSDWKEKFLHPSMAHSTMEALASVNRLNHEDILDESPQDKKPKDCHSLASRQPKAGLSQNDILTRFHKSWVSQPILHRLYTT